MAQIEITDSIGKAAMDQANLKKHTGMHTQQPWCVLEAVAREAVKAATGFTTV